MSPERTQTKPPPLLVSRGPRGGQFHEAVTQGQRAENGNVTTSSRSFSCYRRAQRGREHKDLRKFSFRYFWKKKTTNVFLHLPNHPPTAQVPRVGKLRHRRSDTRQHCNWSGPKGYLGSCLKSTPRARKHPRGARALRAQGKVTARTERRRGARRRRGREPSFPDPRARGKEGRAARREDGRPTHPHCRTACHCSRPSCRRHARRRPGHSIAGAHRPRAPPEESPSDGAVSGAFPALRGRRPAASRPCAPVGRGARSPPGTPDGSGRGRGRPPLLESASSAGGRRAAESPRPGAAQRLASPPPPGPHPPAPLPCGGRCAARVAGAPRTARPWPAPSRARGFPGDGRGGHLLRVPRPSGDARPGAARPRPDFC